MEQQKEPAEVEIARAFATEQGRAMVNYEVGSITNKGAERHVFFRNPHGRPGDHFTVVVDVDQGKALRLVQGR